MICSWLPVAIRVRIGALSPSASACTASSCPTENDPWMVR